MTYTADNAAVFVTTYAVGNEQGFATGKWFELTDYEDKPEFIAAATDYAIKDLGDKDPELCYPDYEISFYDLGLNLISESGISAELWDTFDLEEHDAIMLDAYIALFGRDHGDDVIDMMNKARGVYVGYEEDAEAWAYDQMENSGDLVGLPDIIKNNIDWDGVYDWLMEGHSVHDGHYFINYR